MIETAPAPARRGSPDPLGAAEHRLAKVNRALGLPVGDHASDPAHRVSFMLHHLAARVSERADPRAAWLALIAVTRRLPELPDVDDLVRRCVGDGPDGGVRWLLTEAERPGGLPPTVGLRLVDGIVVDVDFSARHDLNTGIQRVVRRVAPILAQRPGVEFVAWGEEGTAPRSLTDAERLRVMDYDAHVAGRSDGLPGAGVPSEIVVPWRGLYVCPEVPSPAQSRRLAAVAARSGNRLAAIGYDCIPVVSADLLAPAEGVKFMQYLALIKHAHLVVAISAAAAEEFRGFADMLRAGQRLPGPGVEVSPLPTEVPGVRPVTADVPAGSRQVVVVGSHDVRKNHLAVLAAAERLWSAGTEFDLLFIGGRGWRAAEFDAAVARSLHRGRRVRVQRGVPDRRMWAEVARSRFSVFVSLHEGYGLPAVESRALGIPVVTSDRGSLAELASGGGMLAVDPEDDAALTGAMRRLLDDDELVRRLSREALAASVRTWADYADEVWRLLDAERSTAAAR